MIAVQSEALYMEVVMVKEEKKYKRSYIKEGNGLMYLGRDKSVLYISYFIK